PEQSTGFPIILRITLQNTGSKAITWGFTESGRVPGHYFAVLVRGADGKTQIDRVENESVGLLKTLLGGPRPDSVLKPGQDTEFGAFMNPLPAGDYQVRFISSGPATKNFPELDSGSWIALHVNKEQKQTGARQAEIARAAASGSLFDQFVARRFGFSEDMDEL